MPYLVLGLFLLAAALIGARAFVKADPKVLAKVVRVGGVGLLAVVVVLLLVTGRIGLALPLLAFLPMLLARWRSRGFGGLGGFGGSGLGGFGGLGGLGGFGGGAPSPGQTSEVETAYLTMTLDHDSGEMRGQVRQGRFRNRGLDQLTLAQLLQLLAECQADDPPSSQLLETYLDRTHGDAWREAAEAAAGAAGGNAGGAGEGSGRMTTAEAYDVLGLQPGATPDEIRDAHRRLMKKLHPDQGGSTYLASKINAAKDLLLGS